MQLKAGDISNNNPITLEANKTLYDVRNILIKYNVSRVVIVKEKEKENKEAIGIITEKDIARFLFRDLPRKRLDEIRIDEVIRNQNLITAKEDTDVSSCAKSMLDNSISSLIINADSILRGILTKTDLLDAYAKGYGGDVTANEYMTKRVLTVNPDESVHMVLLIMVDSNVSRVVVVEDNNKNSKPVGIITSHDLLPASTALFANKTTPYTQYWIKSKDIQNNKIKHDATDIVSSSRSNLPYGMKRILLAKDIMKFDPIMVTDYADLLDVALIMKGNRISGLPVVDSNDKLVGIITKSDIARAIVDGK
ncbi:MAG: CBS domain-containing protein [Nitrososphaeraceae archaeon]